MGRTSAAQLSEYSPDFFDGVRSRGREYFRRRAVRILQVTPHAVTASVQGSTTYSVLVQWDPDDDGPVYECTCPYFNDRDEPCKHIWATILQANAEGVLPGPDGEGEDGFGDEDEENDEPPPPLRMERPSGYGIPAKAKKEEKGDPGAWKKQLKNLTQPANARPGYGGYGGAAGYASYGPPPLNWPA